MDRRSNFMQKSGLLEDLEGQLLAQFDCLDERHLTHKNIVAGPVEGNGCPQPSETGTDYENIEGHAERFPEYPGARQEDRGLVPSSYSRLATPPAPAISQHESSSIGALSVRVPKAMG